MDLQEAADEIRDLTENDDLIVTPTADPNTIRLRWGRGDENKIDLDRKQAEAIARVADSAYSKAVSDFQSLHGIE